MKPLLLLLIVLLAGCSKPPTMTDEELTSYERQRNLYPLPEGADPQKVEWIKTSEPFFVDANGTRYTIDEIPGMGKSLGIEQRIDGLPDPGAEHKLPPLPPEVIAECKRQGIKLPEDTP